MSDTPKQIAELVAGFWGKGSMSEEIVTACRMYREELVNAGYVIVHVENLGDNFFIGNIRYTAEQIDELTAGGDPWLLYNKLRSDLRDDEYD